MKASFRPLLAVLAGLTSLVLSTSASALMINGGTFDGTDVGGIDTYIAETGLLAGDAAG
ncbi:MAG: hypothetical protein U5K33_06435 [Halofilum sp. (in: g-proteobacteria)]|nr:hypothetical protein [Halofilum sp. (in: g-proteobacteria)]